MEVELTTLERNNFLYFFCLVFGSFFRFFILFCVFKCLNSGTIISRTRKKYQKRVRIFFFWVFFWLPSVQPEKVWPLLLLPSRQEARFCTLLWWSGWCALPATSQTLAVKVDKGKRCPPASRHQRHKQSPCFPEPLPPEQRLHCRDA